MRKSWKKIISIALVMLSCVFFVCCKEENKTPTESVAPENTYVLNEYDISLSVDETFDLTVISDDEDGFAVNWQTSNARIATVENGRVTGLAPGSVQIVAVVEGKALTCTVTVSFAYENAVYMVLENELETEKGYALKFLKGDSYTLAPVLMDGEKVEDATFTLSCEASALNVSGLTITAMAAVENAEVLVSCSYQGKIYGLTVTVTVLE